MPSRTPDRTPTGTPGRTTTVTPPKSPPVRFNLPGGPKLRRGEFPRVVSWQHGDVLFRVDLLSGRREVEFAEAPHSGKPSETFRVIATSETPPNILRIDLGESDAHIMQQGIEF